jgi:aarF domain-containing kinase
MTTTSSSRFDQTSEKLKEFSFLVKDIIQLASKTGVRVGFIRSSQLAIASFKITSELLVNPNIFSSKSSSISPPKILKRLFEELGATYIKLGQFIASSPTLFPAEYVTEFQTLLDQTPTIPFIDIKEIIQKDLAKPINKVYSYIDPVPVASASVAQVHKAKLIDGTEVCIKVQKPGVDSILIADLNFLTAATKILEFINPSFSRISLANIVSDIKDSMLDELDFRKEAQNLINFRSFLERNNIMDTVAPRPYLSVSSKRVLTMEYLKGSIYFNYIYDYLIIQIFEGVPLVDLEGIKKYSANPEATLVTALRTWGLSVMENDRFHADVHGGNLLVLEDGRIGFIDFGIGKFKQLIS